MANKYLALVGRIYTQVQALVTSAGAGDSGKIVALDSTGKLDVSVMPVGIGAETIAVIASEALSAGNFVNIWNNAGTLNVRKADATTNGKPAHGFVLAAVSSAGTATVYTLSQTNTQLSSLTPGSDYFLATTAGGVITPAPSTAGNIVQYLGTAHAATALVFANTDIVELS